VMRHGGARPEAQGPKGEVLGDKTAASSPAYELGSLVERCKLTQWGPGRSRSRNLFLFVFNRAESI